MVDDNFRLVVPVRLDGKDSIVQSAMLIVLHLGTSYVDMEVV